MKKINLKKIKLISLNEDEARLVGGYTNTDCECNTTATSPCFSCYTCNTCSTCQTECGKCVETDSCPNCP